MQDFSTTQDQTEPVSKCPSNCQEAMDMVKEEVNRINRIPDALKRNVDITQAYRQLGREWKDNWWIRLAGYVSTQGGCAMKNFYVREKPGVGALANTFGRLWVNPRKAIAAFKDANTTIFSSVYPPNKFMHNCGFERLKECNDAGAFDEEIDETLMKGLEQLHNGNYREAADLIATHEQRDVVQPVYKRHKDTFDDLEVLDDHWMPRDQTSIPVSYECTRDNLVPLGDLEIQNPTHRIRYYEKLMDRMMKIEGLP